MRNPTLGLLTTGIILGALTFAPSTAQAQRGYSNTTVALTVRVPSMVKVVLDGSQLRPDGSPVFRVVTNDPAIRAQMANGVPAELIRRADDQDALVGHAKGSEPMAVAGNDVRVIRYTVVAP